MRRVVINMRDFVFADAVAQVLCADGGGFEVFRTSSPDEVVQTCRLASPYALLMEVTGYPPYVLEERLKIGGKVREHVPGCKLVLLADENSEAGVARRVKQAKKDGLIDQFFYGSVSAAYLTAMMDAL